MIICPSLKIVFVHIPKTAGTSLTRLLAPHTSEEFRSSEPRIGGKGAQATWHYKNKQHAPAGPQLKELDYLLDNDWRFLTVVRDPYDWLGSVFLEFYGEERNELRGGNFLFGIFSPERRVDDFPEFFEKFSPGYPNFFGFNPQSYYIDGIPKDKLITIYFENYNSDLPKVLNKFGINVDKNYHMLNRGDEKKQKLQELRDNKKFVKLVNDLCDVDFTNFSYRQYIV